VYVVDGSRREASGAHLAVELLDVLRFELGDSVGPDPGHEVPGDVGAVTNQRLVRRRLSPPP
jgi:hypothetical protein